MDDRIHAWLDGEIPFEALTDEERAEARALEARILAAAASMSRTATPDLTARVMAALPDAVPGRQPSVASRQPSVPAPAAVSAGARFRSWLESLVPAGGLAPRPALAMAALALMVGFGLGTLMPRATPAAPMGPTADADAVVPQVFVRFELEASGATDVRLAGSFTGWEASHEMTPVGPGLWTVTLPLEPGVHDYVFVVDGEHHVVDPYAPRVADGFGGYSSRLALLTPQI
jgi:hypothetical protein